MITKILQKIFQMRTRMINFSGLTNKRPQKFTKKKRLPIRVFVQGMLRSKSECFFFSKMSGVLTNFSATSNQIMCKSHFFSVALFFRVKKTQKSTSLKIYLKNQFNFSLPNLLRSIVPKTGWSQRKKQISQHACEKNSKCLRIENCFKITNK